MKHILAFITILCLGFTLNSREIQAKKIPGLEKGLFEYTLVKEIPLPNLNGIPGYRNLKIPVFKSSGTKGPGILLIHGNSSSSRSYVFQVFSRLGRKYKIFLLDLPGFGRSEKIPAHEELPVVNGIPAGFPEYQVGLLEAVYAVANDPDINPEIFVGWSLAGDILLLAQGAGMLPNAKGIFIFGTAPAGAAPPTTEAPFLEPNIPGMGLSILTSFGFSFQADPGSALGFNFNATFSDPVPEYAPEPISDASNIGEAYMGAFFKEFRRNSGIIPGFFWEDGFDRSDPRARASIGVLVFGLLQGGGLPDELDVLQGLDGDPQNPDDDIPIAVLVGEEDAFVNKQYLEDLASSGYIPTLWRNEIIEVKGAGHAIQFERPFKFNRLLKKFVSDVTEK
ncbi:MAG: alpha/beta hydrolase [bacterium]|nr:alpha/beta hydrolase [bacterium]